tara:strand:+ start:33 stop:473 length:441 start_codon:yes stop_codon:yes gene_type:complete
MINFDNIFVGSPEYSYFNDLSGSEKIEYLIEIYDLECRKESSNNGLELGLEEFFHEITKEEIQEFELTSHNVDDIFEHVDVLIDPDHILIESDSLKAVRHITRKIIGNGYILIRDKETEKEFKKSKVGRYLRIYSIIGNENHLCLS